LELRHIVDCIISRVPNGDCALWAVIGESTALARRFYQSLKMRFRGPKASPHIAVSIASILKRGFQDRPAKNCASNIKSVEVAPVSFLEVAFNMTRGDTAKIHLVETVGAVNGLGKFTQEFFCNCGFDRILLSDWVRLTC
jgi:hypothetical protein